MVTVHVMVHLATPQAHRQILGDALPMYVVIMFVKTVSVQPVFLIVPQILVQTTDSAIWFWEKLVRTVRTIVLAAFQ